MGIKTTASCAESSTKTSTTSLPRENLQKENINNRKNTERPERDTKSHSEVRLMLASMITFDGPVKLKQEGLTQWVSGSPFASSMSFLV